MAANIVTTEDLEHFKEELIKSITEVLLKYEHISLNKWIKSKEVMDKLGISPGTLQNMRNNKTIPWTKLEGNLYYDEEKINKILEERETNIKNSTS